MNLSRGNVSRSTGTAKVLIKTIFRVKIIELVAVIFVLRKIKGQLRINLGENPSSRILLGWVNVTASQ